MNQAHSQILLIILLTKYRYDNKKCEMSKIKYKDCECCFENINVKEDLIECKCLCCNKNYQSKSDENFKEVIC